MTKPTIEAIVFDFDGLLADSEPIQIDAWEQFLARYDRELAPSLLDDMFGLRVHDSSRLVQERLSLRMTPAQVMQERDEIFLKLVESEMPLMRGARELVGVLRRIDGLRLALATSGHRRYIEQALRVTGLDDAFDAVVTGDRVHRGKPDPEIYLLAAYNLGVSPGQCVALEDAPHGVRSAKDAGMICLVIPNAMTHALPGFDAGDAVLDELGDVVPWLEANVVISIAGRCDAGRPEA